MGKIRLRTRFLLSLLALSTGLTSAMLLVVRYRVEKQVRESIREDLHNSVRNYESFERLREATLTHTAVLVADMPNLRALMTTQHKATIQDGSKEIWQLSGSDLFVLTSISGEVLAFQSSSPGFSVDAVQGSLRASLDRGNVWDWWFNGGHLYQIWLQPIYFGDQSNETLLGFLAIGQEVDRSQARNFSNVASSEAVFRYGNVIAASTLSAEANVSLEQQFRAGIGNRLGTEHEIQIGSERYLGTTVRLSYGAGTPVSLSVLKSFDRATTFLKQLNRVLLILGFVSVLAGTLLAFLLSKTITRPLAQLVTGLHAFEGAIEKLRRDGIEIFLTAVRPQPMKVMFEAGLAERIGLEAAVIGDAGGRGKGVLSGKVFEYLAAERPILAAVPPGGEAARLIRETGAGVVADPDDVAALGAALADLHGRWAAGTLDGVALSGADRERLGRGARVEELADVLRGLVS